MIQKDLLLVDYFESDFKGKKYKICKFYDVYSGVYYTGSNLDLDVEKLMFKEVKCNLEYKNKKMVVASIV